MQENGRRFYFLLWVRIFICTSIYRLYCICTIYDKNRDRLVSLTYLHSEVKWCVLQYTYMYVVWILLICSSTAKKNQFPFKLFLQLVVKNNMLNSSKVSFILMLKWDLNILMKMYTMLSNNIVISRGLLILFEG